MLHGIFECGKAEFCEIFLPDRQPWFLATKIQKRHDDQAPPPILQKTLEALQLVYTGARSLDQGDLEKAETTWKRAVAIDPACTTAWSLLTDFFEKNERIKEAAEALSRWAATAERTPETLFLLGKRSCALRQFEQGKKLIREALLLDPSLKTQAALALAAADSIEGDWEQAILLANDILRTEPENTEAFKIRQQCWHYLGWLQEEIADYRNYIAIQPDLERHSRLLYLMNYLPETTPEQICEQSLQWTELYADPLAGEIVAHGNTPDPERRLRVAYIAPDLTSHVVMKLAPAVFEAHNRENFEVFGYTVDARPDAFTEYVRRTAHGFVNLPGNRKEIAGRIRHDGIDILVDLAGRAMHADAYLAFATKPAPLQVGWLGVPSTSGLRTMDYFLGDARMPRTGTEPLFTEKIYRLPRVFCAYHPAGDIEVDPPPCIQRGHITFGCFDDPKKITPDVAKVWSILLHLHPETRLLLKHRFLEREIAQRLIRGWFADYGISMDRILFEGESKPSEHLGRYGEIDIALDPFPYQGVSTTLDALWAGVPVVSLRGRLAVACAGSSLLSSAGLSVANTVDEYIGIANQLANDMPTSPNFREEIRDAMKKSPLMDQTGLVRALETAYRDMWRTWCAARA